MRTRLNKTTNMHTSNHPRWCFEIISGTQGSAASQELTRASRSFGRDSFFFILSLIAYDRSRSWRCSDLFYCLIITRMRPYRIMAILCTVRSRSPSAPASGSSIRPPGCLLITHHPAVGEAPPDLDVDIRPGCPQRGNPLPGL